MSIMSFIPLRRFLKNESSMRPLTFGQLLRIRLSRLGLVLIVSLLGAGCTASQAGPGTLEVRVRDHREAIADFSELWLTIATVAIHPAGQPRGEGWIELQPSVQQLDLTQYVAGPEVVIVTTAVEPGAYNAIRLTLEQAKGTLVDGQPAEVAVNLGTIALDYQVSGGRTTVLELDLVVLDMSDHPAQGYELHLREATVN